MNTKRSRNQWSDPALAPRAVLASRSAAWCGTTIFKNKFGNPHTDTELRPVKVKKVLILSGAALLVFFLVTQPVQSAALVTSILDTLKDAAEAVITFVRSVFNT
jgi:hypothetical protein